MSVERFLSLACSHNPAKRQKHKSNQQGVSPVHKVLKPDPSTKHSRYARQSPFSPETDIPINPKVVFPLNTNENKISQTLSLSIYVVNPTMHREPFLKFTNKNSRIENGVICVQLPLITQVIPLRLN